jgi:hypothetical protein
MGVSKFWSLFGLYRPVRYEQPGMARDYDHALYVDHPEAPSLLDQYIADEPAEPRLGGAPKQTAAPTEAEIVTPSPPEPKDKE